MGNNKHLSKNDKDLYIFNNSKLRKTAAKKAKKKPAEPKIQRVTTKTNQKVENGLNGGNFVFPVRCQPISPVDDAVTFCGFQTSINIVVLRKD